ncbi:MAG: type II secretion system protein [Gammaproteobacteria bacterium]|nr:type II secretion system protein [Gammaproteobacteria bacterium]
MSVVRNPQNSGFTLIEMLSVVILLGILGVVALGRIGGPSQSAARGFYDDTVTAVSFAQKFAISSGCDVRVVTTASSYALFQSSGCNNDNFANAVLNPANRSSNYANANIPNGFTLTTGAITFDARGLREEATSDFVLSDGATSYSFRVYSGSGLVERL